MLDVTVGKYIYRVMWMIAFVCTKKEEAIRNGELLDPCFRGVMHTAISSWVIMKYVIKE
jgi:hypothetical protein